MVRALLVAAEDSGTPMTRSLARLRAAAHGVVCVLALAGPALATPQVRPFTAPLPVADAGPRGRVGSAVAVGQRVVALGAPGNSTKGPDAGAVQILERDAVTGAYLHTQTIIPSVLLPFDRFGASVALHGNLLVVGAKGDDGAAPNAGAAYVYVRGGPGAAYQFVDQLVPQTPGVSDCFGLSVSVLGNRIAVGAPRSDLAAFDGGAVQVYTYDAASGAVQLDAVVTRPGAAAGELFGSSVAVFLDQMVVGAERVNAPGGPSNAGSVSVFQESAGSFTLTQELFGTVASEGGRFGASLAFEPPRLGVTGSLVVGAPEAKLPGAIVPKGAVVVFEATLGAPWAESFAHGLDEPGNATSRGAAVALQGAVALVGAPGRDAGAGAVEILRRVQGSWQLDGEFRIPSGVPGDLAGTGVGFSNQFPVIGAPGHDLGGTTDHGWAWSSAALWAPIGHVVCAPGTVNSTGTPSVLAARGSAVAEDQTLTLEAGFVRPGSFGFAIMSQTAGLTVNPGGSDGTLCLDGVIGRYTAQPGQADGSGRITIPLDLAALPAPLPPAVQSGETWFFQIWHRDLNPTPTSNFTTAVAVTFD